MNVFVARFLFPHLLINQELSKVASSFIYGQSIHKQSSSSYEISIFSFLLSQ